MPLASGIILLPFYIGGLSTKLYGAQAIYVTLTMLIQTVVTYGFDSSIYIHFHEFKNDKLKLSRFVSSAFIFMMLISLGTSLILFIAGSLIFDWLLVDKGISFYPYGIMALASGVFQALIKVYSSLLQSREMPVTFFWSNVLYFALILGLTIGGLYFFPDTLIGPITGRFVASLLIGIWVLIRVFREYGLHFDFDWLKTSFAYNNYLFIYQIQQWIINYFDKLVMAFYLPLEYVGIYDFTLKCLIVIEVLVGGMHSSFLPKIVGIVIQQPEKKSTIEINRYYNALTAVIILLVCACIGFFPIAVDLVIEFLKKADYQKAIQYIPYVALLYLPRALRFYFLFPYSVLKYSKPLPLIYLVAASIKIGLMVLLTSTFGIFGVLLSAFMASVAELVLLKYYLRDRFEFKFNSFKMIYAPALILLLIMLCEILFKNVNREVLHASYLVFSFALLVWVYRAEIDIQYLKNIFFKRST